MGTNSRQPVLPSEKEDGYRCIELMTRSVSIYLFIIRKDGLKTCHVVTLVISRLVGSSVERRSITEEGL